MKPFIKWAGGKEKELPYIIANLPEKFTRYVEPFVGGGAVYFGLDNKISIINDKSDELINVYKMIKNQDKIFIKKLKEISKCWNLLENIVNHHSKELQKIYKDYCKDMNANIYSNIRIKVKYEDKIIDFVIKNSSEFNGLLEENFNINIENFLNELQKNLLSKITRMYKIEQTKGQLEKEEDIINNIETAFKSAYYMHFRYLYNYREDLSIPIEYATAIFYFIREYCYASMFRYNKNGKFNVPYGGMSYNRKDFSKKVKYVSSLEMIEKIKNTQINNFDFEEFCQKIKLNSNDFIFLDPPYDTEFSTYMKNEFNKQDQIRLANFLKKTSAKFMLVIKNTEFIYELYNVKEFNIKSFDKKYLVSFQNRNDKDVEHLIITNY